MGKDYQEEISTDPGDVEKLAPMQAGVKASWTRTLYTNTTWESISHTRDVLFWVTITGYLGLDCVIKQPCMQA